MRVSLMDFLNLEKELKESLKIGIVLLKKKKRKEVIYVQYVLRWVSIYSYKVLLYYSVYYIFTEILFGDYNGF